MLTTALLTKCIPSSPEMARSHSGAVLPFGVQEIAECPVCCERFVDPLQLSCGHSLCSSCVDRLYTFRDDCSDASDYYDPIVRCPECRQDTRVPAAGLPVNYRLRDMVALMSDATIAAGKVRRETDSRGGSLPNCLACNDVLAKGVYMSCCDCVLKDEKARQICSVCCLRHHNGHHIVEKHILTVSDIVAGRKSLRTAHCQGLIAIDRTLAQFDISAASVKEKIEENAHALVHQIEVIDEEILRVPSYEEFQNKIKQAQDISTKLEQMSTDVKILFDGLCQDADTKIKNDTTKAPPTTETNFNRFKDVCSEICMRSGSFCDALLNNLSQFTTSILALVVNCFNLDKGILQRH
ncbi:unnamed protein product [Cylicocyclus nassatus]|uniref:RING-type domain-containing protein n=1 Tax=Cylicocyclus nassatus TaxID=53992 RepID=A0AA36DP64_CYLNA|nr:unnamed protein product [Cylicocyclus nassatus]